MILRKDKEGWVFGFRVHPDDAPRSLLDSPLGTRFHAVMFQINDDETYVVPPETQKGRMAVATAGQMCREESFQNWMLEKGGVHKRDGMNFEAITADLLREYLNIQSRAELSEDPDARDVFKKLILEYRHETRDGQ